MTLISRRGTKKMPSNPTTTKDECHCFVRYAGTSQVGSFTSLLCLRGEELKYNKDNFAIGGVKLIILNKDALARA